MRLQFFLFHVLRHSIDFVLFIDQFFELNPLFKVKFLIEKFLQNSNQFEKYIFK